jgi:thioredoxin-related protein
MNYRKIFLNCLLFLAFAFLPACSNTNSKTPPKEAAPIQPAPSLEPGKEIELPVLKAGDNLAEIIKTTKIKNTSNKIKPLKDFFGPEKTLIAVVKPGCIYCESLLSIKGTTGVKSKAKFLVVLDASHADYKTFKEKYNHYKSAGGEWLLDVNDDFKKKFGVNSYPRFLLIDKNGTLEQIQIGLFMPANKAELEGKSFPEILQKLSEETLRWMSGI